MNILSSTEPMDIDKILEQKNFCQSERQTHWTLSSIFSRHTLITNKQIEEEREGETE
jgi:hypothetical protein